MADAPPDFQTLGADIRVVDDLDEDEILVVDIDCYAQDIVNGLSQPTGISDGTEDGQSWGIDIQSYLNAGLTPSQLGWLQTAIEVQALQDDRTDDAHCTITVDGTGSAVIDLQAELRGQGPYLLTYILSAGTLALAQVEQLG